MKPLSDRTANGLLVDIAHHTTRLAQTVPEARQRLRQWEGSATLRSTPTDTTGGHTPGGHADPTGNHILTGQPADEAADRLAQLDHALQNVVRALLELHNHAARTLDTTAPKDLNEGCELCATFAVHRPALKERVQALGDKKPKARCEWHSAILEKYGKDLHTDITRLYVHNPDIRVAGRMSRAFAELMREHHKDLWHAHHSGLSGAVNG